MIPTPQLITATDLAAEAAALIADALRTGIEREGRATLALSGGSTPGPAYRKLVEAADLDWSKVHVFWVDDRCVPADDPQSNERLAHETLLDHVGIPDEQVYPMACAEDPDAAAEAYDQGLKQFFGGQRAQFDVVVLGVGDDGHVASLFPGADAFNEQARWALHTLATPPNPVRDRLTLTLPAINGARLALFIVSGERKRAVIERVFQAYADAPSNRVPAAGVRPTEGQLVWLADAAATPCDLAAETPA